MYCIYWELMNMPKEANYVKRETVIWVNQVKIVNNLKMGSKKNHVPLVTQYMTMFDSLVFSILTFYYIRNFYKSLWFDVNQTWMPNGSCILSSELIKSCQLLIALWSTCFCSFVYIGGILYVLLCVHVHFVQIMSEGFLFHWKFLLQK